jgi:hypothetical protein
MLVSELITQTRRLLFTGAVEERNQLAENLGILPTTFLLIYDVGSIDRGAKISINLEDMYVWGKTTGGSLVPPLAPIMPATHYM